MTHATKTKVAILGGGAGALAAAFALTSTPERRARVEVTVHQLGFRLGGKAASGRSPEPSRRSEEHGHHTLAGCYENTFRLLRACYDELARPPGAPLATWQEAFKPQSHAVVLCKLADETAANDGWFPWTFRFPSNDRLPGDGGTLPSPWSLFRLGVEWLWSLWTTSPEAAELRARPPLIGAPGIESELPAWILSLIQSIEAMPAFTPLDHPLIGAGIPRHDTPHLAIESGPGRLIAWIRNVVRAMPETPSAHDAASQHVLTWLLRKLTEHTRQLLHALVLSEPWAYKLWVTIDLTAAMATGFLADGVLFHGWPSIDHLDFRTWLKAHGATDETLASGPVQALYDMVFAFVNGDPEKGNLAAGTAMSGLLRLLLTYKGAIFWELAAAAGDTVFGPLYEVLKQRGVKLEFFHRVAALRLVPGEKQIGFIDIVEQVKLRDGYEPLIDVHGLPCWPNAPRHEQIEDGDELKASAVDLESPYSPPWKDAHPLTLECGKDFDVVVLGIALGAIPYVASELIRADRPFASMVANIGTVQTFSFQLWLDRDLAALGWPPPGAPAERPLTVAYVEPCNAWSDRTPLLAHEPWPADSKPQTLAHFGGPLSMLGPTAAFVDHGFAARQKARVQSLARLHLENDIGRLWPLASKSAGHGFRWDYVIAQHHRANVDPSDRHTLSVAGSRPYRLPPAHSGFENLVLAGDWTATSLDLGCLEAAIESGLLAAEALLGEPVEVFGR